VISLNNLYVVLGFAMGAILGFLTRDNSFKRITGLKNDSKKVLAW
jgi:hypothetical protein